MRFRPQTDQEREDLSMARLFVIALVRRSPRAWHLYDDLMQEALLGICEARAKFDPARGIPFRPYASFRVRGRLCDFLRGWDILDRGDRKRVKSGMADDVGCVPLCMASHIPAPMTAAPDADDSDWRWRTIRASYRLTAHQGYAVRRILDGKTVKEIAAETHTTHGNISQQITQAIQTLRRKLKIVDCG